MRKVSLLLVASFMAFALLSANTPPATAAPPECIMFKILPEYIPDTSLYPNKRVYGAQTCTVGVWVPVPWFPFWYFTDCQWCCNMREQYDQCGMCIDLYGCACAAPYCYGRTMVESCW